MLNDDWDLVEKQNYSVRKGDVYSGQMYQEQTKTLRKKSKNATFIPHGKGTMTQNDGQIISEGLWKQGEFVEGLRIFANGERFEG